jgi:hypothetical protein
LPTKNGGSSVAIATTPYGDLHVVVTSTSSSVYHAERYFDGSWSSGISGTAWGSPPVPQTDQVAIAVEPSGMLDVLSKSNGTLALTTRNAGTGTWNPTAPVALPAGVMAPVSDIAIATDRSGRGLIAVTAGVSQVVTDSRGLDGVWRWNPIKENASGSVPGLAAAVTPQFAIYTIQ